MGTKLAYKDIPLEVVEQEQVYILLDVKPVQEYDTNGKPTDKVVGFFYEVVNAESFEKYRIKILDDNPLMSSEALLERRKCGDKIFVEFENASIKMYWNRSTSSYEDSFSADGISFVGD